MSRKASERRFNPDAFVEANLWVVTRGRPYKPRFRAERAVVIVSGGGAVRAGAPVAPPREVHGRREADASSRAEHSSDPPRHTLAAVLGAADAAAALFEDTACDAVYVLDFGPLRGDVPAELASPHPGRVAKSVARLLRKLNVSDALLAASGADVAVLLKVLSSTAEHTKAVVLHEPDAAAPAAVLAGVRAAAADGAARRLGANLRIRYAPAARREADRFAVSHESGDEDDGVAARRLLAAAFPDADATSDAEEASSDEANVGEETTEREEREEKSTKRSPHGDRACVRKRFAAALVAAAHALEARDDVSPPPAWLASSDAPVFYARATFEHDKFSKQIQQTARNVTDVVRAARAAAEEAEEAEEAAVKTTGSDPGAFESGESSAVPERSEETPATKKRGDDAEVFGGAVGVLRPEAFVLPAKGTDEKPFPEGKGCFYPKMPCLECGSPWWLGDSWYAACANCGGDAESYDNEQQPHEAYARRFARFRELIEALRGAA